MNHLTCPSYCARAQIRTVSGRLDAKAAEEMLRHSMALANSQGALSLELRSAMALGALLTNEERAGGGLRDLGGGLRPLYGRTRNARSQNRQTVDRSLVSGREGIGVPHQ